MSAPANAAIVLHVPDTAVAGRLGTLATPSWSAIGYGLQRLAKRELEGSVE